MIVWSDGERQIGEAAESLGFRNSRHLQQRQTASARTDEDEFC